jgi:hypothetical protein
VVAFTACFDDGGAPDSGNVLCVAGFVSTDNEWSKFNRRWREYLRKYHVTEFHMKDFAHSVGQFAEWRGKETKRRRFLNGLIREIVLHAAVGISSTADLIAWREANKKYQLIESKLTPLSICGGDCVEDSLKWYEKTVPEYVRLKLFPRSWLVPAKKKEIKFVFDQGSKHWGTLVDRTKREYGVLPIPGKRQELPALQAADLYAYEHRIKMRQWRSGVSSSKEIEPRVPLVLISQHLYGESHRAHYHMFEHWGGRVPLRTNAKG